MPPLQADRLKAIQQLVPDLLEDQRAHGVQPDGSAAAEQHQQLPKHKQLEHALRHCSPIMVCVYARMHVHAPWRAMPHVHTKQWHRPCWTPSVSLCTLAMHHCRLHFRRHTPCAAWRAAWALAVQRPARALPRPWLRCYRRWRRRGTHR